MKIRLEKLRESMRNAGLDGLLLSSSVNIRYYTGFTSNECLVLLTDKRCSLITDFRYTIQAQAQAQTSGRAEIIEVNQQPKQFAMFQDLLMQQNCKRCGFEQNALTVGQFQRFTAMGVEWVPFDEEICAMRKIKSAEEIESLRKAQQIADRAFADLIPRLRPGMTERQAEAELNYLCSLYGSEGPSFDPIVGSGENGAMCHAIPGQRKLCKGDLVVFDFGCVVDGYHSDMTRTIGIGAVDDTLKRIYEITLEAQQRCLDAVRAGITGRELDAVAREYIQKQGYGDCFGHGLGHGFGLEIHEPPRAAQTSDDVLESGMTITIEPGIYLAGKGGVRIEDCVVVTDNGCYNLVSTAKNLLII